MIAAVVLAAGTSSRFGGTKQVARVHGKPLVQHVVDAAREAGIEDVVVVVGHDAEVVGSAVEGARIVVNTRFAAGQATSLAAGLDALGAEADAAVVLLADQPGVSADDVRALVDAARSDAGSATLRIRYLDGPGPALLRRSLWPRLRALSGDVGARAVLDAHPDLVRDVPLARPTPLDVDTPEDLAALGADGDAGPEAGREEPPSF